VGGQLDLSADLQDWIHASGLELTQGSQTSDGRTVLWNKGGEVRYFINLVDGWYVVTSSDRMSAEGFEFAGSSMLIIEKYFYGDRGWTIRRAKGLPRIQRPCETEQLQPGYSIDRMDFGDRERPVLIGPDKVRVAIAGVADLVELSTYVDTPVDAIKDSFLDPQGNPLFASRRDS
jgi:hypothetical protein